MEDLTSLSFLREFERHVGSETGPIED
jgi:hypothetical protein